MMVIFHSDESIPIQGTCTFEFQLVSETYKTYIYIYI